MWFRLCGLVLKKVLCMKCRLYVMLNMFVSNVVIDIVVCMMFGLLVVIVLVNSIFLDRKLLSSGILVIVSEVMIVSVLVNGISLCSFFSLCMLWVLVLWLMMLVVMNSEVLKVVWLRMWNMLVIIVIGVDRLNSRVIRFRWEMVEYVSRFFRLCWKIVF